MKGCKQPCPVTDGKGCSVLCVNHKLEPSLKAIYSLAVSLADKKNEGKKLTLKEEIFILRLSNLDDLSEKVVCAYNEVTNA